MTRARRLLALGLGAGLAAALALVPAGAASAAAGTDNRITLSRVAADKVFQVFTVDPVSGASTQMTKTPASKCDPALSPALGAADRREIAYVSGHELHVMPATAYAAPKVITLPDAREYVRSPAWSHDGLSIAFLGSDGYGGVGDDAWETDIWTITRLDVNSAWSLPTRLTTAGASSTPTFAPDGRIAYSFASTRLSSERDIWTMAPDGSDPRPLFSAPGSEASPQFHPGDDKVLYTSSCSGAVMEYDISEQASKRVVSFSGCIARYSSKDPTKVVFDGNGVVKVLDRKAGTTTTLSRRTTDRMPDW